MPKEGKDVYSIQGKMFHQKRMSEFKSRKFFMISSLGFFAVATL